MSIDPLLELARNKKLTGAQLLASEAIYTGYIIVTDGIGLYRIHVMERYDKGTQHHENVKAVVLERSYRKWARKVRNLDQCIDMIVLRASPNEVDRARHQRNGKAYETLVIALDEYCSIRGWV